MSDTHKMSVRVQNLEEMIKVFQFEGLPRAAVFFAVDGPNHVRVTSFMRPNVLVHCTVPAVRFEEWRNSPENAKGLEITWIRGAIGFAESQP